jgi:chromosome segregation ATPase
VTEGLPLWAVFVTLVLSGGVGAGLLKVIETWVLGRSSKGISSSQIKLNDVNALNLAVSGLAGENGRMAKRLADLETKITSLEVAIEERDKRIDDLEAELEEQRRRRHEIERHLGNAEKKIEALAKEMKNNGLDPTPVIGVPF